MFYPAAEAQSFDFFRLALFILACGLATLETVAHPFSAALGHEDTSEQRINLSQTFNGVGAIIGPVLGSYIILRNVPTGDVVVDLAPVKYLYIAIGLVVTAVAVSFHSSKYRPLHPRVLKTKAVALGPKRSIPTSSLYLGSRCAVFQRSRPRRYVGFLYQLCRQIYP